MTLYEMTVIEIETGKIKVNFKDEFPQALHDTYGDIAISNNGRTVVAHYDFIRYYDEFGNPIRDLHTSTSCLAINPHNNNLLAIATAGGNIEIWNLETGTKTNLEWNTHSPGIRWLEFNRSDGSRLISASSDGKIQVWNSETGEPIGPEYKTDKYDSLQTISFDGTKLAYTSNRENEVRIVNVDTGNLKVTIPEQQGITRISFDPEGSELIASYSSAATLGCIRTGEIQTDIVRWLVENGTQIGETFEGVVGFSIRGISLFSSSAANKLLVSTMSHMSTILIWDRTTAKLVKQIKLSSGEFNRASIISPDGKYLLILAVNHYNIDAKKTFPERLQIHEHQLNQKYLKKNLDLAQSSNLGDVTDSVISDLSIPAPVCAGISEWCIADGIALSMRSFREERFPITGYKNLFFGVTPSHKIEMQVIVDPQLKKVRIQLTAFLDIYYLTGPEEHRISRTHSSFTILASPSVAIGRADITPVFEIKFDGSTMDFSRTTIIDPIALSPIK